MTPQELKNSILQLAIQGKLVEQFPLEGTAEELFAQIQQEKKRLIAEKKIKREKPLPEITEDEKPFDIPESWMWVRVQAITCLNPKNDLSDELEVSFIPMALVDEKGNSAIFRTITNKWTEDLARAVTMACGGSVSVSLFAMDGAFMKKYGVQHESWGPFAQGRNDFFTNPVLNEIGQKYNKSAAQTALRFLLQSGGRNLSKEVILARVWGYDSDAVENHVEVYVGFLRKKLASIGSNIRIEAIRKMGYHLEADEA